MRLVQLIGYGVDELWEFTINTPAIDIETWYKEYEKDDDYDLFEEYMEDNYPNIKCRRVFVDEIYV